MTASVISTGQKEIWPEALVSNKMLDYKKVPSCQNESKVTLSSPMNIFLLLAHPEPRSFNGALFRQAQKVLAEAGHSIKTSELYAMAFNPVSDRHNFTSIKNPGYFKPQVEEKFATEINGFAPDVEQEIQKLEWCDLMIWQFPLWWFGLPAILKGWADRVLAMGVPTDTAECTTTVFFKGNARCCR
jgi:putative NADPH-quinone reductase